MPWSRIWRRRIFVARPPSAGPKQKYRKQPHAKKRQPRFVALRPKTLRRTGHRHPATRGHAHHRKPALIGAVGAEPEQAVDAGKAGWIGQYLGRKPLLPLRSRQ